MSQAPATTRRTPTVYASEDDLERVLTGHAVELPYRREGVSTVIWSADPHQPLTVAAVEQLRDEGLSHRLRAPGCDEPFFGLVRVGASPHASTDSGDVLVELSADAYRLLCGIVQSGDRIDRELLAGAGWEELRRSFPAAGYVREPLSTIRYGGIAATGSADALETARSMVAESVRGTDHDLVCLVPVHEDAGRYSVTVLCHRPQR